jgi:F-type H+-transporting ATPase subunit b
MIESLLILATEAHEVAEGGGFGLNLNILETNLINLAILVGVLIYYAPKTLGKTLSERRSQIAEEIAEAEERQQQAAVALAEEQQKLAQAQAEAERIRQAAEARAQAVKAEIAAKAQQDIERLRATAAQDLSAEAEKATVELRRRAAALALQRVEAQLKSQLDEPAQQKLIDRSLAQLGGRK